MRLAIAFLFILFAAISGCAMHSVVNGEYYMRSEMYREGVKTFQSRLKKNPDDPSANFYMGQYLLALDEPAEARPYLEKAVTLEPARAEYHYKLGLVYSALGLPDLEEACYRKTIAIDEQHAQAQLYLGHILMQKGRWSEALNCYERVLAVESDNPQALYNRGLALRKLERKTPETLAWKEYLKYYPEGKWAIMAADHLNERGDFEYRNFTIGHRRFPIKAMHFTSSNAELDVEDIDSLNKIGSILVVNPDFRLDIVVHYNGDSALALARAESIRGYILRAFPGVDPSRLKIHASARPEVIKVGSKKYSLKESVVFVTMSSQAKQKS